MSRITKDWIADDAVDASKINLGGNTYLKGRNNADLANVDIVKVNASDAIEFASLPKVGAVDVALITDIPTLPSTFELQGNWNANTNTPTLVSSTNSTGDTNPLYIVNVAGTTTIDGESLWSAGDHIYFANGIWNKADNVDDVLSVNAQTGVVVLDADDISDTATTNKFATAAELALIASALQSGDNISVLTNDSAFVDAAGAKTAAVVNSTAGSETDQAASVAAMKSYVGSSSQTFNEEVITLVAQDITNGYIDLAQTPISGSLHISPKGGLVQESGTDYTISTNRVTFAGDLATYLVATDKLLIHYAY